MWITGRIRCADSRRPGEVRSGGERLVLGLRCRAGHDGRHQGRLDARIRNGEEGPHRTLSGTPLVLDGTHLRAKVTVPFKPNSPNAESADGKYVYTLDLAETSTSLYKGTMTIDWTMTIVWSATNRNEFHAVYKADVSAHYNSVLKILHTGVAKGTATTTDIGITTGSSPTPHKSTGPFEWTFESQ